MIVCGMPLLNIADDFDREVLHIETDTTLPTLRLICSLEMFKTIQGLLQMIGLDNIPELISAELNS